MISLNVSHLKLISIQPSVACIYITVHAQTCIYNASNTFWVKGGSPVKKVLHSQLIWMWARAPCWPIRSIRRMMKVSSTCTTPRLLHLHYHHLRDKPRVPFLEGGREPNGNLHLHSSNAWPGVKEASLSAKECSKYTPARLL